MNPLLVLAVVIALVVCFSSMDLLLGVAKMRRLSAIVPIQSDEVPMVSLIVPACNEEKGIRQAILSQLQQSYTNLEIIAVNDRSTDSTGSILRKLEKEQPKLTVIEIGSLPPGWMGKTHGLHLAAQKAQGQFLLFTDGDVIMEKTTISRAVHHMLVNELDHMALIFKNISPGWLLNSLILDSGAGLLQLFRPWLARRPNSSNFIGVGAFNMVKKEAYEAVGGHLRIRMHPIDDIMLGKIIKRAGYAQECLLGDDLVTVHWYASVGEMINGLMKNVMAIINYRYWMLPPLLAVMFFLNIFPLWAMIFTGGYPQLIFAAALCVKLLVFFGGTRLLNISMLCAPGTLITPYISMFILMRAAWFNYRDKGIFWRGTHYRLSELRKNEPLWP